ncbi:HD domain-containing protein [Catenulispora sp. NF23]|uniref:HD domain-containing protein n=1 Tax=Catenulispora pinistramenti TaxID=2705254 RepID=UPI001BA8A610|nr:HD domain-containing protein [Catenulispora pinistramenti]MBS2539264.1 HD domain-containing protein [Catenulispora pinistramenti]
MIEHATAFAQSVLAERLPRRWAHSLGVLREAQRLAPILGPDAELLASAAVLHDVGYASEAIDTGQHMIDGGRFLRRHGFDERICWIVAHHTSSPWEAAELGLSTALEEFPVADSALVDAITYCDLCAGPDGASVDPRKRLAEVLERYGSEHVVFRAVTAARPYLLEMVDHVNERLGAVSATRS